jgi:hypothetical protein
MYKIPINKITLHQAERIKIYKFTPENVSESHLFPLKFLVNLISDFKKKKKFVSYFHYKTIRRYNWNIVGVLKSITLTIIIEIDYRELNKVIVMMRTRCWEGDCSFHCIQLYTSTCQLFTQCSGDSCGRNLVVDGFTTTYAISACHH